MEISQRKMEKESGVKSAVDVSKILVKRKLKINYWMKAKFFLMKRSEIELSGQIFQLYDLFSGGIVVA